MAISADPVWENTGNPTTTTTNTNQANQTYMQVLQQMFAQYNLGTLATVIGDIIKQGQGDAEGMLTLYQSQEYRDRFKGNEGRQQPLTPDQYLKYEQDLKNQFAAYGLPADFYDDPANDFAKYIQNDLSPNEVGYRAQKAWDFTQNADQATKDKLSEFYGLTNENDIVAYFLDPDKGAALIQKREQALTMGAAARRNNVEVDRALAERLQALGVDPTKAAGAFADLGAVKPEMDAANARFKGDFGTEDQVLAATTGLASAERKRKNLAQSEAGLFADRGVTKGSTTTQDQAGNSLDKHGDY